MYGDLVFFCILSAVTLTVDTIQPKCLSSDSHKPEPSSEKFLHGACSSWQSLSCCNENTTIKFHTDGAWRGFDYNHCGPLSDSCREYFNKELCLYECDPYLAQWTVEDTSKKMRRERYYKIPLCQNDCNNWFNACKDDYTCRDNWNKGFKWVIRNEIKVNECPSYESCETFKTKFGNSNNFCNRIWDESFEVTNSLKCISFNGKSNEIISQRIYHDTNDCNHYGSSNSLILNCLITIFASILLY